MRIPYKILATLIIVAGIGAMAFQQLPTRPHNYEPVMMTRADLEASIEYISPQTIDKPGKMWIYNNYILLIEQFKGIHIINNADPNAPENIGFLRVEGCGDLAVKDGVIYANNAIDLIGIKGDASFSSFEVVARNRNVIPMVSSPEPWNDWYYVQQLPEDMIIIRWELLDK